MNDLINQQVLFLIFQIFQSATCYSNSLIQTLHIPLELCELQYKLFDGDSKYLREKLFIQLQLQLQLRKLFSCIKILISGASSTQNATETACWTADKARTVYVQQNVSEISDMLFNQLKRQSQHTAISQVISDVYREGIAPAVGFGLDMFYKLYSIFIHDVVDGSHYYAHIKE